MLTTGTLLEFFVIIITVTLLSGSICCEASGRGAPGKALSREFLLSLRTSTAGAIPDNIPRELSQGAPEKGKERWPTTENQKASAG
jgi:hypothetical protein